MLPMNVRTLARLSFTLVFASCFSGCGSLMDSFNPPKALNPEAWEPRIPEESQEFMPKVRPLRENDEVKIVVISGSSQVVNIADIIDTFGNITLPHLGEFKVGGLTTSEAEVAVRNAYIQRGFYTDPKVTLIGGTRATLEYFVTGAVHKKGNFHYRDDITLWQAIVAAGDLTQFASKKIKLTRKGTTEIHDLGRIKKGVAKDPPLRPGDIIEALETWL